MIDSKVLSAASIFENIPNKVIGFHFENDFIVFIWSYRFQFCLFKSLKTASITLLKLKQPRTSSMDHAKQLKNKLNTLNADPT